MQIYDFDPALLSIWLLEYKRTKLAVKVISHIKDSFRDLYK